MDEQPQPAAPKRKPGYLKQTLCRRGHDDWSFRPSGARRCLACDRMRSRDRSDRSRAATVENQADIERLERRAKNAREERHLDRVSGVILALVEKRDRASTHWARAEITEKIEQLRKAQ